MMRIASDIAARFLAMFRRRSKRGRALGVTIGLAGIVSSCKRVLSHR